MTTQQTERIENWNIHPSQRGVFAYELYKAMAEDNRIHLLVGDLGFGVFNNHRDDFPDRFLNTGASEMAMMGIAVGLALEGKIPFVYSITNFLLFRPFETLRTYVNAENIGVKLVGAGRDRDYQHDGISHWSEDAKDVLNCLPKIRQLWPETKEEIPAMVQDMVKTEGPVFISLRR